MHAAQSCSVHNTLSRFCALTPLLTSCGPHPTTGSFPLPIVLASAKQTLLHSPARCQCAGEPACICLKVAMGRRNWSLPSRPMALSQVCVPRMAARLVGRQVGRYLGVRYPAYINSFLPPLLFLDQDRQVKLRREPIHPSSPAPLSLATCHPLPPSFPSPYRDRPGKRVSFPLLHGGSIRPVLPCILSKVLPFCSILTQPIGCPRPRPCHHLAVDQTRMAGEICRDSSTSTPNVRMRHAMVSVPSGE